MNIQNLIQEITNYVTSNGGIFADWYVGISATPKSRLFDEHGVEDQGVWISAFCDTSVEARSAEAYFIEQGMKGGVGGGDYTARGIYCYKINSHSIQ